MVRNFYRVVKWEMTDWYWSLKHFNQPQVLSWWSSALTFKGFGSRLSQVNPSHCCWVVTCQVSLVCSTVYFYKIKVTDLILCACYTNRFCFIGHQVSPAAPLPWVLAFWRFSSESVLAEFLSTGYSVLPRCVFTGKQMEGHHQEELTWDCWFVPWSLCKHYGQISASLVIVWSHCLMGCPQNMRLMQGTEPLRSLPVKCTRVRWSSFCISPLSHKSKPVVFKQRVVISLQLLQVLHKYEQIL